MIRQGACAIVCGKLGSHVQAVVDEVVCVGLEEGAVRIYPGGGAGGFCIGVGEDEDVAGFFDRLLFSLAVVVADGVGVGGADVVDCPGLRGLSAG